MSNLAQLQDQLQDTSAALLSMERVIAKNPNVPSLGATHRSLARRQQLLETQFMSTAKGVGLDVCSYRSFTDRGTIKAAPAFAAIAEFQTVFSVTYDAQKNGPKARGSLSQHVMDETAFEFGYGFMGSVGFVLTLANERTLFDWTNLDAAMETVFALTKAKASSEIMAFARKLGIAPVNAVYRWAALQVKHSIGADVDWRRGEQTKASLFVQPQELAALTELIDGTSDVVETDILVEGTLDSVNHIRHTFEISVEGGQIHGTYGDAIDPEHQVQVPGRRYAAFLRKMVTTSFSTGAETVTYFLKKLSPLD